MAYSYTEYTGDGTTQTFTIPFAYEAESEVAVFVAGTQLASSDFSFLSTSTISINTAPANNANVRVERNTDLTNRAVDFVDGAVLSEADLDTAMIQVFHGAQEAIDTANDAVSLDADGVFDAQSRRIKNVADPSAAQDAATKNYIENVWLTPSDKTQLNNLNLTNLNTVATDISNVNTTATNITDVNTVATDIADVNTVAGDSADIQTLAAISTDITTAAGISSDITTVAAKAAAVQKVADDLNEQISEVETVANDLNEITSEIETVANSITNVDTVGTNIGNVNTVAGINANVTSVAGNASNINAAVANAANINAAVSNENNITAVANNETNINAVNSNSTNINTVAGNTTNITTVATNNANVTTVASNIADVQTAATNVADIQTIATEVQKVITVANDLNEATSEIDTVAASISNVDAVGADIANVNAVAGNATNINAVNANSTNINAVAGNSTNINTVAGAATNINTVASNIADVNSFADTYSIGSTAPASPTSGDLWFDTSVGVNTMKVYNGTSWQNAGSSVNGTSARFKYTATSGQTTFSGSDANGNTLAYDSGYIDVFLNGIHLDPTDYTATNGTSIVLASGAGLNDELYVVAFGTFTLSTHYTKTETDNLLAGISSDALIDSGNTTRVQATTSGADVTGDVNVGGLVKVGFNDSEYGNNYIRFKPSGAAYIDHYTVGQPLIFRSSNASSLDKETMRINSSGNVGIGTSSPTSPLEVNGRIEATQYANPRDRNNVYIDMKTAATANDTNGDIEIHSYFPIVFSTDAGNERMRIDRQGRIITPSQVGFKANYAGNGFNVSSSGGKITQDREIYDIGGCYDPTNSRFTAPISGRYLMTFHIIYIMTGNSMVLSINVNGYSGGSKGRSVHFTNNIAGHWQNIQMHQILDLNANDYVELTYSGSNTGNFHGDDWNHWSMMLLG